MIAVDTNVVVRLLANDDPAQVKRAAALFESGRVLLSKTVLLETEWVLRYSYGRSTKALAHSLRALIDLSNVTVEDLEDVRQALDWFEEGLDFADALHLATGRAADSFATFDRKLIAAARRATKLKVAAP